MSSDSPVAPDEPADEPLHVTVPRRLTREGRWAEAAPVRDQLVRQAKQEGRGREWAYKELAKRFPPPGAESPPDEPNLADEVDERTVDKEIGDVCSLSAGNGSTNELPARTRDPSVVTGLGDIPESWPKLPPNASLAAEIQWVQSSRIDVVEELPSGSTRVHLDRADRPAPSKAALGWLETSIRAYSKYCDIAAKATSQLEDEKEHVRREKLAIDEVRALLAEMLEE